MTDTLATVRSERSSREHRSPSAAAIRARTIEPPDIDLVRAFAAAASAGLDAVLWSRPDDDTARLAIGSAATLTADGPDRVASLGRAWSHLRRLGLDAEARAFVGFSFAAGAGTSEGPRWDAFPEAVLVVPRLLLERDLGSTTARAMWRTDDACAEADIAGIRRVMAGAPDRPVSDAVERRSEVDASERPTRDTWRAGVARARVEMREAMYEKLVLARAVCVGVGSTAVEQALASLTRTVRGCTVFAVARDGAVFLGATPESLVSVAGRTAHVSCVAGTAARQGANGSGDSTGLLRSEKDLWEHSIVVRSAVASLSGLCDDVRATAPHLMELRTLWHLASDVTGRLRPGVELLDVAAALHPTPAVCGSPREVAARLLAEREPFARGWYGGGLGWVDAQGEGELMVGLRCALVRDAEAWVFAGCGLVADSDPDAELAECDAKMRPMLEALAAA